MPFTRKYVKIIMHRWIMALNFVACRDSPRNATLCEIRAAAQSFPHRFGLREPTPFFFYATLYTLAHVAGLALLRFPLRSFTNFTASATIIISTKSLEQENVFFFFIRDYILLCSLFRKIFLFQCIDYIYITFFFLLFG